MIHLSLRDMQLVIELARILDTLHKLDYAAVELRGMDFTFDSLSKEIARIERRMGVKRGFLVEATPKRGSIISDKGRSAARAFAEMIVAYHREMKAEFASHRERVNVGMTNSASSHMLSTILTARNFSEKWPKTDIQVVEGYPEDLQGHLLNHLVDFCVAPDNKLLPGVVREPLCVWHRVFLFRKDHPQFKRLTEFAATKSADRHEKLLVALLREVNVLIPLNRVLEDFEYKWLKIPTTGRILRLPQAAIRRDLAQQGFGVAVAYREPLANHDEKTQMETIDLPKPWGETQISIYCRDPERKSNQLPPEAERLVAAIRDKFGDPSVMQKSGKNKRGGSRWSKGK